MKLNKHGYVVKKSEIDTNQIKKIKEDLTIKPHVMNDFGTASEIKFTGPSNGTITMQETIYEDNITCRVERWEHRGSHAHGNIHKIVLNAVSNGQQLHNSTDDDGGILEERISFEDGEDGGGVN